MEESGFVKIIGSGLAGSEAALQLAKRGFRVQLYEMRPQKTTGAHKTDMCAEFVCSNSLGSSDVTNASGLLKREMELAGGELIKIAKDNSVPAGNALAISRDDFAKEVTKKILENQNIEFIREEISEIPDGNVIIATGPLTSEKLAQSLKEFTQKEHLHFFDAIAPIVEIDSINFDKAFWGTRYDKGEASYINCPMNKEEYERFYQILTNAPKIEQHEVDKNSKFFESCLPIEVLASRGVDTLRFGPMKPVGLVDKRTGVQNHAVVQLRQDNADARLTEIGHKVGLISEERFERFKNKMSAIEHEKERCKIEKISPTEENNKVLAKYGITLERGYKIAELLKRPDINYEIIKDVDETTRDLNLPKEVYEQVEIQIKYDGYILRQNAQVEQASKLDKIRFPNNMDFMKIEHISSETKEKLAKVQPKTLGQASRIGGIKPADISVLMVLAEANKLKQV